MKPRLAIAYDSDSSSPMEIRRGLGDGYDLIWVVDSSQPPGPMDKVLPRLGAVVDFAGHSRADGILELEKCAPEGIVTFSDSQLDVASAIAAELGLRFNSPNVTARFLDKYEQRAKLRAAGLIVPSFVSIPAGATAAEISQLTAAANFPAVLKPRSGYASRETHRVERADGVLDLLVPAGARATSTEAYVLEEYLPDRVADDADVFGSYVSVESVVVDGEVRHLAVTGKFALDEPFRETGNFIPSLLEPDEEREITALAGRVADALGVEYGCLHTEIKLTPDGPRVIESNARVGGGGIEDIFMMSYDESLLGIAAYAALGVDLPATIKRGHREIAYQFFVQPPQSAHHLVLIGGLDDVGALPGVEQLALNRRVGDAMNWRRGSLEYVLWVRGSVPDRDALRAVPALVREQLVLEYS